MRYSESYPVYFVMKMKFLLPLAWALVILVLCMLPQSDLPSESWFGKIPYFDKLVHFGLYFVLFWTLHFVRPNALVTNVLICIGYGILIEILQKYLTTYRSAEVLDAVADAVGATFAAVSTLVLKRRRFV